LNGFPLYGTADLTAKDSFNRYRNFQIGESRKAFTNVKYLDIAGAPFTFPDLASAIAATKTMKITFTAICKIYLQHI